MEDVLPFGPPHPMSQLNLADVGHASSSQFRKYFRQTLQSKSWKQTLVRGLTKGTIPQLCDRDSAKQKWDHRNMVVDATALFNRK